MAVLTIDGASLSVGAKELFSGLNLQVAASDRIGVVGPNGSGKTSLFRLIAGEIQPDEGAVVRKRDTTLGYLPQQLQPTGDTSIIEFMRASVSTRAEIEAAIDETEHELCRSQRAEGHEAEALLLELSARLAEQHERLARLDSDYSDHNAHRILRGLGFTPDDAAKRISELSGGWQMRVVLAGLLFAQPDLLLLDEPTNHLDMPSVAWLGSFLRSYRRPLILICHDRDFLNEQVNRILSFEPEGVRQYTGDFEKYVELRAQEAEVLANRRRNILRERQKAEQFIVRFRAQATKARAVQSRIKALERTESVIELEEHRTIDLSFSTTSRTSRQVLRTQDLCKRYGDATVFEGLHLSVLRGEKVGVIGVNGAGKTTLLRILAGRLKPEKGSVELGNNVRVGYYAQDHAETLVPEHTVLEEVQRAAKDDGPTGIRTLLGALGFSGDDVEKPVRVLSGGERARVALARLLVQPYNCLVMDEPTNHLDLASSERLAQALATYDGALIFASHNRSFVRQLANAIWNVAGGTVETYPGSLDDYLTSTVRRLESPDAAESTRVQQLDDDAAELHRGPRTRESERERRHREAKERERRRRVLRPIEEQVASYEKQIEALEKRQRERSLMLADPDVYQDPERAGRLSKELHDDNHVLEQLNERWERAELEREQLLAQLEDENC